jgi:hypothetical protein
VKAHESSSSGRVFSHYNRHRPRQATSACYRPESLTFTRRMQNN